MGGPAPDLATLLEQSAERTISALQQLRAELLTDRQRDDDRFKRVEASLDSLRSELRSELDDLHDEQGAMGATLTTIEESCAALVVEEDGPDGEKVRTARPARIGLDPKTVLGALVVLVTSGAVPVLVAYITTH